MGFIGDILSAIWKVLKKVLLIVLLCLAVYFTGGGALTLFGATFTGTWAALACLGLALLIDPETVTSLATNIASTVGDLAGSVIGAAVGGLTGSSGIGSLLFWAVGGYIAYRYLTSPKRDEKETAEERKARLEDEQAARDRAIDITPSFGSASK